MKGKQKIVEEEEEHAEAEDWCFMCKDGGTLLVCDYKKCSKSYHPDCVGKDDSFLDSGTHWTCDRHTCFICHKPSKFRCYVCPQAVCTRCIDAAEFVHVRNSDGFCVNCLKLALLVEENKDIDSDGERVDFKDLDTVEGLFMEYWEIINEKEGFTIDDLRAADVRLKKELNYISSADEKKEHKVQRRRKRSKCQTPLRKNRKSSKKEYIGWGSKSLIQFLESIGKNTGQKLSQHEVCSIINGYIKEKDLVHPVKKRKVVCDEKLQAVLGRKIVNKHAIFDLLDYHFVENLVKSDDDDEVSSDSSDDKHTNRSQTTKRKRNSYRTDKVMPVMIQKKKAVKDFHFRYAEVGMENIKLVYLRKSLLLELAHDQPEKFKRKVMGSFVRARVETVVNGKKKNFHQLMQVTGVKKCSPSQNNADILLQLSDMPNDVHISLLSDNKLCEEDCIDLKQRIKDGLREKLTIVELEKKARMLHEDVTKHRFVKELGAVQIRLERASLTRRRKELQELFARRTILESPEELSRALNTPPTIIPDITDFIPITYNVDGKEEDDNDTDKTEDEKEEESPKSISVGNESTSYFNDRDGKEQVAIANCAAKVTKVWDEKSHNQTGVLEETKKKQQELGIQPIDLSTTDEDDNGGNHISDNENRMKKDKDPPKLVIYSSDDDDSD